MPAASEKIEDLSDGFMKRIKLHCENGKPFRFNIYDKQYKFEISPSGSGIRSITILPKDFDSDSIKIAEEVIRIRKEIRKKNKLYVIGDTMKDTYIQEVLNKLPGVEPVVEIMNHPEKIIAKGLAKYGIPQMDDIKLYLPKTGASTVASFGASQTGKSTLLRYVAAKHYLNKKYINFLYTVSANIKLYNEGNEYWDIRNGFNDADGAMIEMQKNINFKLGNKFKFMNFFDDILELRYSKIISKLCLVYRNQMISTWISTQYPALINKSNRVNINSTVLFRFHQCNFIEDMIKTYLKPYFTKILGKNASMDEMINFYMLATEDHGFIYIVPFEDRIDFVKLKV